VIHVDSKFRGIVCMLVALVALSACTNQMEPAKKAIAGIEAAVTAAGPDAQQYIPDQLKAVTDQLAGLKAKFDQKDYAGVLAAAPAILNSAQGLLAAKDAAVKEAAAKAAAAQAAAEQTLKTDWTTLADAVPVAIASVDSRVTMLTKSKKLPAGLTKDALAAAQTNLAGAKSLWQQATTSQTAGQLSDAVAAAKQAREKIDAALAGLGMSGG
jgi:hypothetical protein